MEKIDEKDEVMTLETNEVIEIGVELKFADLWNGEGDGKELLESGSISPDNTHIIGFEILEDNEDILNTIIKVTDIY